MYFHWCCPLTLGETSKQGYIIYYADCPGLEDLAILQNNNYCPLKNKNKSLFLSVSVFSAEH